MKLTHEERERKKKSSRVEKILIATFLSKIKTNKEESMTCFIIIFLYFTVVEYEVDTVQDFLIKLGIKPGMQLWEIGILSLNNIIGRSTKTMNRADKNWAHFYKTKYFKNQSFQKISTLKVDILV